MALKDWKRLTNNKINKKELERKIDTVKQAIIELRRKFRGKAKFRVIGTEHTGYRLIVSDTTEEAYRKLKKMENKLQRLFDVEIVLFR